MKKFPFLILMLVAFETVSQTYHPFPTDSGCWVYRYYDDNHMPTNFFGGYVLNGDTIISGINYKKISGCSGQGVCCNSGGLREDNKIIYFRPDTSTTEYVLYNFNLNLGDTLFYPFGGGIFSNQDTLIVVYVDSVSTPGGYLRRLQFDWYITWIEGVGSIFYLLNPGAIAPLSGNDNLECMVSDSVNLYPGTPCPYCIPVNIQEKYFTHDISISPNPFQTSATLQTSKEFANSELIIFNTLGRKVKQQNIYNGTITINREGLTAGIYFFRLTSNKGHTAIGKFIID
ncbi:MAG: T9SS type A sorting domain-containing protein [Bacteroidia bacterium]